EGTLTTYNVGDQPGYGTQELRGYNRDEMWIRTADLDGNWGSFKNVNGTLIFEDMNAFDNLQPIADYPRNTISIFNVHINSDFPYADTVLTYRIGNQSAYYSQELRRYGSPEVYKRYVYSNGTWSDWELVNPYSVRVPLNLYSASQLITAYPDDS